MFYVQMNELFEFEDFTWNTSGYSFLEGQLKKILERR
jgi:hypothetical protein